MNKTSSSIRTEATFEVLARLLREDLITIDVAKKASGDEELFAKYVAENIHDEKRGR